MQQPRGIAVILGVLIALGIIAVAVTGVVLIQRKPSATPTANANSALNLACTVDADCSSYCGTDSCYQPICGTSTIGGSGSCTCRSLCGPIGTTANTNTSANVNASTNANTNASINTNVSTVGWVTQKHSIYGYSIQYPSTYVEIEQENGDLFTNPEPLYGGLNPDPYITVTEGTIESVMRDVDIYNTVSDTSIKQGDLVGRRVVDRGGNMLNYFFQVGNRVYMLRGTSIGIHEQMFKTFTFTK